MADLRKLDSETGRGDVPRQARGTALPAQSRDGPETASPFGSGAVGTRAVLWGPGQAPSWRMRTSEFGERRVRRVTLGQDRASVGGPRERRPVDRDGRIVPGEAELVGAVVLVGDQVDQLERVERQEPVGDPGRDDDPLVGAQLARLDERRRPAAIEHRAEVDEGDEGPPVGDDPQVVLAAVQVEAAQDAGRRGRQVGLDERLVGEVARPPQLAERAARVRMADDGAVANARQRRRGTGGVRHALARVARRRCGA